MAQSHPRFHQPQVAAAAWGTVLLAYILMAVGGQSTIGQITGLMTIVTTVLAWRAGRKIGPLVLLVLVQAVLGITASATGLHQYLFVRIIHLWLATFVWVQLLGLAAWATWGGRLVLNDSAKFRRLGISGVIGVLIQITLASLSRHTGSGLACEGFPLCGDTFLPDLWTLNPSIAFSHRWWGILLVGLYVHFRLAVKKHGRHLLRWVQACEVLYFTQISLGIATVISGIQFHTRLAHTMVGFALLAVTTLLTVRAGGLRWTHAQRGR